MFCLPTILLVSFLNSNVSNLSFSLQPGALDFNNQLLAPQLGGKGMWGSWGKGSSGGTTGAKPAGEASKSSYQFTHHCEISTLSLF